VAANGSQLTINEIAWDERTKRFALFLGEDPNRLHHHGTSAVLTSLPSSVSIIGPFAPKDAQFPAPDPEFDRFRVDVYKVRNAGYFGAEVTEIGTNTITVANARWTPNEWAGEWVSVIGETVEEWDTGPNKSWRIVSNTADTLTINPSTGPTFPANYTDRKWLITIRMTGALVGSSVDTVLLPGLNNSLAVEEPKTVVGASNANPIVVEVTGHGLASGDRVRLDEVLGNTAANGIHTVTVIDDNSFTIPIAGNGDYEAGGQMRRLTGGLLQDEARGKVLRIIAGTGAGQAYRIRSNSAISYSIEGFWQVAPDATSIFITHEPEVLRQVDTGPVTITEYTGTQPTRVPVDVSGYSRKVLLFTVVALDGANNASVNNPSRDTFLFRDVGPLSADAFVAPNAVRIAY
jgi:hypothetical protein